MWRKWNINKYECFILGVIFQTFKSDAEYFAREASMSIEGEEGFDTLGCSLYD